MAEKRVTAVYNYALLRLPRLTPDIPTAIVHDGGILDNARRASKLLSTPVPEVRTHVHTKLSLPPSKWCAVSRNGMWILNDVFRSLTRRMAVRSALQCVRGGGWLNLGRRSSCVERRDDNVSI
jgi:hypothetical protein